MKLSLLASRAWWKAAALRGLYTAVAIAVPYFGGALLADVPWLTIASAAALGFVASLLTSLAGLPETVGTDLPWWLAAVERVVKTFAQSLGAGFVGATLLTDVAWSTVLQAAVISALISLLRLILATLPNDPTPQAAFAELVTDEHYGIAGVAPTFEAHPYDAPARAPGATASFEADDGRISRD
jgi:hypothetical protein